MATNYRRGYDLERRLRKRLEAKGWFVIRSAGSKTPVDLVAFNGCRHAFVQCSRVPLPMAKRQALVTLAERYGAIPLAGGPYGFHYCSQTESWPWALT